MPQHVEGQGLGPEKEKAKAKKSSASLKKKPKLPDVPIGIDGTLLSHCYFEIYFQVCTKFSSATNSFPLPQNKALHQMCRTLKEALVPPSQPTNEIIKLSTMDQHALRMYTNFVLVFKTELAHGVCGALQHLEEGLGTALSRHPEFAATVVPKPGSARRELELEVHSESGVPFRVVDHSPSSGCCEMQHARTYQELKKNNFPLTNMPESTFFMPNANPEDELPAGVPGLLIQANVVEGGLLLGISWHHTICDGRGIGNFVESWAKATAASCLYGDAECQESWNAEASQRWRLSCGIRGATPADFPDYVVDASSRVPNTDRPHLLDCLYIPPPGHVVSMWHFSKKALLSLVSLVNDSSAQTTEQYLPVESLSALVWKHVSLAKKLDVSFAGGTSLFTTRVDYRRRVFPPLPYSYIGNANQPVPRIRVPIEQVCAPSAPDSLASLASYIRRAVAVNDNKVVRKLIGYIETLPSVTDLALSFDTFPGPDVAITDTSGLDAMSWEWGSCLGRVDCIRPFVRYKGFTAFLPQDTEGGIPVYLQCDADALERLKEDAAFTKFGTLLY